MISFEIYNLLRKGDGSDGIIPQLVDNYLEVIIPSNPSMTRTTIFSNITGEGSPQLQSNTFAR
jgi:hypothetical protein